MILCIRTTNMHPQWRVWAKWKWIQKIRDDKSMQFKRLASLFTSVASLGIFNGSFPKFFITISFTRMPRNANKKDLLYKRVLGPSYCVRPFIFATYETHSHAPIYTPMSQPTELPAGGTVFALLLRLFSYCNQDRHSLGPLGYLLATSCSHIFTKYILENLTNLRHRSI